MVKNVKATKKFEQRHLKGVLERRKASAKNKQRAQLKAKKQARRAKDQEYYKSVNGENGAAPSSSGRPNGARKDANVSKMSVDEFFEKDNLSIAGPRSQIAANLGKRKRTKVEEKEDDSEEDSEMGDVANGDSGQAFDDDSDASDDVEIEDVGMTKQAMDELAQKDPDFYKFLQENDPEALDFDENADLAEVDQLSGSEDDDEAGEDAPPKKKQKKDKSKGRDAEPEDNTVTRAMVARWKAAMTETYSLRATRQVVLALRAAAHLNDDAEDEVSRHKYAINSPEVFHDVLIASLKHVPDVLQHHVPIKETASGKLHIRTEGKKFKTLSMLLKSYTTSILNLLASLSDDASLKLTLSALAAVVPYLLGFRKLLKPLIKTVVSLWSQPASSETTKITAFLVLRRLVVAGDKTVREVVLKAAHQGLLQGCRSTNANTIAGINLVKNSAAELWGIDQTVGYTTAFTLIRQLAIHLRNSIVRNQNDAFKKVYNWQFVHSLDFWSCVLAEHCNPLKEAASGGGESQLRLLIYPLVQVTLGAMGLIPTALYFPLRFQLMRSLLRLSRATGTYIPLAASLLDVLNSAEMRRPPKPSKLKALDFATAYKAPKAYLRTRVYQDGVGEQVVELLGEYFAAWSTNIAFPEFALPAVVMLKRWLKQARRKGEGGNKNAKVASALVVLVQKLEANAKFVEEKRRQVRFAPRDRAQVEAFLRDFEWEATPLGAYVAAQRKVRAERAKAQEEARKEADVRRREAEEEERGEGDVDMIEAQSGESDSEVEVDGFASEEEGDGNDTMSDSE